MSVGGKMAFITIGAACVVGGAVVLCGSGAGLLAFGVLCLAAVWIS